MRIKGRATFVSAEQRFRENALRTRGLVLMGGVCRLSLTQKTGFQERVTVQVEIATLAILVTEFTRTKWGAPGGEMETVWAAVGTW